MGSGLLWYRTSSGDLVDESKLSRARYESTTYFETVEDGKLSFVLVVQVDNYIYAGDEEEVARLKTFLRHNFGVGKLHVHKISEMGFELEQK